jgi:hypothetical protein
LRVAVLLSPLGTQVALQATPAGNGHARLAVLDLQALKSRAVDAITDSMRPAGGGPRPPQRTAAGCGLRTKGSGLLCGSMLEG